MWLEPCAEFYQKHVTLRPCAECYLFTDDIADLRNLTLKRIQDKRRVDGNQVRYDQNTFSSKGRCRGLKGKHLDYFDALLVKKVIFGNQHGDEPNLVKKDKRRINGEL